MILLQLNLLRLLIFLTINILLLKSRSIIFLIPIYISRFILILIIILLNFLIILLLLFFFLLNIILLVLSTFNKILAFLLPYLLSKFSLIFGNFINKTSNHRHYYNRKQ